MKKKQGDCIERKTKKLFAQNDWLIAEAEEEGVNRNRDSGHLIYFKRIEMIVDNREVQMVNFNLQA